MTEDVTRALAVLGVAGQAIAAVLLVVGLSAAVGLRAPLDSLRRLLWGYELWLAFAVTAIATGGSLFFSEIAHFVPCELCWFQRICMYPLSIVTLLAALANDHRVARYLLPLPVVGSGVSIYHLLVEHGVVARDPGVLVSAPGGCATKWIDEFGYVTIPALALTGFALVFLFLALGAAEPPRTRRELGPNAPARKNSVQDESDRRVAFRRDDEREAGEEAEARTAGARSASHPRTTRRTPSLTKSAGRGRCRARPCRRGDRARIDAHGRQKSKAPTYRDRRPLIRQRPPQNGTAARNPAAKVTLTEYVDTSCPICRDYVLEHVPDALAAVRPDGQGEGRGAHRRVRRADVRRKGRDLVLAAARQNKAWQMLELLYQNQGNETQTVADR